MRERLKRHAWKAENSLIWTLRGLDFKTEEADSLLLFFALFGGGSWDLLDTTVDTTGAMSAARACLCEAGPRSAKGDSLRKQVYAPYWV